MKPAVDLTPTHARTGQSRCSKSAGKEASIEASPSDELIAAANPMTYVNEKYPPALIFHGTADVNVHHSMSFAFCDALEKSGVPFDLHIYAGQNNFFDRVPPFCKAVTDAIGVFISRHVPIPEPVAAE